MILDCNQIVIKDLNDNSMDTSSLASLLANALYLNVSDIAWLECALSLHKTGQAELSEIQAQELATYIQNKNFPLALCIKKALLDELSK